MIYETVTIGIEVEFLIDNVIYSGIIRYKGPINGKDGLWVGIEADQPGLVIIFYFNYF